MNGRPIPEEPFNLAHISEKAETPPEKCCTPPLRIIGVWGNLKLKVERLNCFKGNKRLFGGKKDSAKHEATKSLVELSFELN